ncbi:TetR/AcrR family transcriptional regulator [Actinotalea caeni]|uniref:TetR/AcrR family transcriptional regulator n=1 Tax=Actinotalea caeni TaxID=1348467 RepID=UPI00139181D1|nr:TetR/AcrR family transcriptional regulator [Actinotalea caeni]
MARARRPYRSPVRERTAAATRQRILSVARSALLGAPFAEFTLSRVARDAGVTTQTVRDHFGAKDDLLRALADALSEDLGTSRRAAPAASTAAAVGKLLDEYEDYGLAAAGLLVAAEHSEALAAMVARGREEHRAWLEEVFGDRLPSGADAPPARERCLAALYAATDVGTWRLLRHDLGHSREMTAAVMRDLVDATLHRHGAPFDVEDGEPAALSCDTKGPPEGG